jgi:hypothetical protein
MTTDQRRRSFEERLLDELRSLVVAEPSSAPNQPGRRTRTWVAARPPRRLALAGGVAALLAVAAGAGVPFLTDGAAPAYAVSRNDDGTVTVEIDSLGDAAGLESKLGDAGIRAVVQYLPPGKACKQPWFAPASAAAAGPPTKGGVEHSSDGRTRFTISKNLPADETLVIMTQPGPSPSGPAGAGPESIGVALAKGEVKQCEIVDAPAGSQPFGPPPGGGQLHTETGPPDAGPSTSEAGS